MILFNNQPINVLEMPYTSIDNFFVDLNANGAVVIENALDINKFSYKCEDSGEKYFDYNSNEFLSFRRYLKTTLIFKKLYELGTPTVFGYVTRCKKNSLGTDIHADDHTLTEKGLHIKYICFWAPLIDIQMENGMLFFFNSDSKEFSNLLKRKSLLDKINISKNGLKEYYISSKKFANDFPQLSILNKDIEKFNGKIYSKNLKKGDLIAFKTTTYHGSFDCSNIERKSLDFRVCFNISKLNDENLKNISPEEPQSLVNVFDNQVLSVVTGRVIDSL